ncbi:hypothetical protein [Metapseudomonas otitidis]|uniref:hypothetical protein n=1 Tax=Metapseudomonas otitidis TaxID=319939 RepID=UPI0013F59B05|nr:hypothetical protein [Pseudomonas otitidis]
MNNLHFCEAQLDAFLAHLVPVWAGEGQVVRLIGANPLADSLAQAAQAQGVRLLRELPGADEVASGPQWIIFTEERGECLAEQLLTCVSLQDVSILAPITDHHFSRRPLFLISIPKSGTHLLYELAQALGYNPGVIPPEFPKPKTWYCLEYSNSHTVAADFFVDTVRRACFGNRHHAFMSSPALFMYRHPLDILVSEANYYEREGKTAFAGWFHRLDEQGRIDRLLDDNWLLGSLRQRIGGFLPWLDFPNVAALSFEELIGPAGGGCEEAQLRLIWSIQLRLQAPGSPKAIASTLFNPNSATFRSGQIGGFRRVMDATSIARFVNSNQDLLESLGYPLDGRIDMPNARYVRQTVPLHYVRETFDEMPLLVEGDVMGCNLVRFKKRLYAVPLELGAIDLRHCTEEQLGMLPAASCRSDLKALLLLGRTAFEERRASLQHLSLSLAAHGREAEPQLLMTHNGYNVFFIQQRYLGLRQAAGPMDLTGPLQALLTRYPSRDLLVASTLDELLEHMDGRSMPMRMYADHQGVMSRAEVEIDELRRQLAGAQLQLERLEQKLRRLSRPWWKRVLQRCSNSSKPSD